MVLDGGELPAQQGEVFVDCTAAGFSRKPARPIFEPGRITLQSLIGGFTTYHAALIAYVEATRDNDSERNRLCPPTPQLTVALDWVAMMRGILHTGAVHATEADLLAWQDTSRLSLTCGLSRHLDDPRLQTTLGRWGDSADLALKKADVFLP